MSHSYSTRHQLNIQDDLLAMSDIEASSSPGPSSPLEPSIPHYQDIEDIPFLRLDAETMEDNEADDPTYHDLPSTSRRAYSERFTDKEKVIKILQYLKNEFPRLSLW